MKEQGKRSLRNSIFFRVTVLFIVALLIASVVLVALNMFYFRGATQELSWHIRSQSHLSLELAVNNKLREYAGMMYRMVTDEEIRNYLRGDRADGQARTVQALKTTLETYANASRDVLAITVAGLDDTSPVVYERTRFKVYKELWPSYGEGSRFDTMAREAMARKRVAFIAEENSPPERSMIHVVLSVWDYYSREDMGVIVMSVDASALWRVIGSSAAAEVAYDFLIQADGRILVHPEYARVGQAVEGYTFDAVAMKLAPNPSVEKADMLIAPEAEISVSKVDGFDIYLVSVLSPGAFGTVITRYAMLASALVLLIAGLFIILYLTMFSSVTRSVREVVSGIREIRDGNLDVRIQMSTRDEIGDIADAFNESVERLQLIGDERDREFRRFLDESERRRKAEIRSLQSQINSHFLYNTLNVINYIALEGNAAKTSKMIESLAGSLRYTLDKPWDEVTVAEEMAWLNQYLMLQKERQPSLFDFYIHAGAEVAHLPMHKLIIQPFVENAIKHGFVGGGSGYTLTISVRLLTAPDRLAIAIYDDGNGISPEKLALIREVIHSYRETDALGIGIENAVSRVRTHYGSSARIYVRSRPGAGTRFNIVLPLEERRDAG